MNKQQRDYEKAKQAKRRVEMKMEAREKSFLKGRGLMDSEGTEADSLYKIEDEALFDMACKNFDALPGMLHVVGNYELNIANYGEDWFGLSSVANDYNPNICNQYMKIGDTAKSFHLQIPFSFNGTAYFNWRFLTFHKMYISQIYVV